MKDIRTEALGLGWVKRDKLFNGQVEAWAFNDRKAFKRYECHCSALSLRRILNMFSGELLLKICWKDRNRSWPEVETKIADDAILRRTRQLLFSITELAKKI